MKNKYDTILVGLGQMGRIWLEVLLANPSINIVALVDINTEAAKAVANDKSLPDTLVYPTLADAIKNVRAQIVVDVTPPFIRSKIVTEALNNKLHVLSEKPMGISFEEVDAIYNLAQSSGQIMMVSQNYRQSSVARKISEIIREGTIGEIKNIEIDFKRLENFKDFRNSLDHPLLTDMAIHHFDLVRLFTNSNCKSILCNEFNPEESTFKSNAGAYVFMEMENGANVSYSGNWHCPDASTSMNGSWFIEGTEGAIIWDGTYKVVVRKSDSIEVFEVEKESQDKLAISLDKFIEALNSGKEPETSFKDNINTVKISLSAIKSSKSGAKVDLS